MNCTPFGRQLTNGVFSYADKNARLKQRKNRFNPVSLITSIIAQTGSGTKFIIASIVAPYTGIADQNIAAKPFHNKNKKEAVTQLVELYSDITKN